MGISLSAMQVAAAAGLQRPTSGMARPTPSPSGAPAPASLPSEKEAQVNANRSRTSGARNGHTDVVTLSSAGQARAARMAPVESKVELDSPPQAVFQTLSSKVQFTESESGDMIVQIVDSETQEVKRQFPSQDLQKLHDHFDRLDKLADEGKGVRLDTVS